MTDTVIPLEDILGYDYESRYRSKAYYQRHTVTTLADTAITAVTPLFDVRPCNHVTINTNIDRGLIELSLRVILDEQFNADAQWFTYNTFRTGADTPMFDNAIKLDTHKLGISYLRLDAHKISDGTTIVNTWYRGLADHSSNADHLTSDQNA